MRNTSLTKRLNKINNPLSLVVARKAKIKRDCINNNLEAVN